MKTTTFKCRVITPMFAGTAMPGECELRPPAIKGALRFWWRALHGHLPLAEMRKLEGEIFGGVADGMGRSSFSLSVQGDMEVVIPSFHGKGKRVIATAGMSHKINVLDYLAYGKHELIDKQIKYHTLCFSPAETFSIHLSYYDVDQMKSVWKALYTWSRFGGIGSQSRNGWGNFEITNWPVEIPVPDALNISNPATNYTTFSDQSRLFQTKDTFGTWDKAMGEIGAFYRSIRKKLDPKIITLKKPKGELTFQNRVLMSQPIIKDKKDVDDMFLSRHAKAILLSVVKEEGRFRGQILLLPYKYLTDFDLSALTRQLTPQALGNLRTNYKKVHDDFATELATKMKRITP